MDIIISFLGATSGGPDARERGASRADLERWLSAELTRRLGAVPCGRTVRPGIGRYAVDIILSRVARPELWAAWEEEFLARH